MAARIMPARHLGHGAVVALVSAESIEPFCLADMNNRCTPRPQECRCQCLSSGCGVQPAVVKAGAGEGNRTLVISLEGFCSTIELHPHQCPVIRNQKARP